ncbi:hypothetical protein ACHAXR_010784 [Thalassiosira sp. AJA248-18]
MRINTSILIAAIATLKKARGDFIPKSRVLERGKPPKTNKNGKTIPKVGCGTEPRIGCGKPPKTLKNGKTVLPGGTIHLACGSWETVVNNNDEIQDSAGEYDGTMFASYNAASVNRDGVVVFRARSTGGGSPSTGVFVRDVLNAGKIVRQAGCGTAVAQPNNLNTAYIEFPSFPRMSINKDYIATRGLHSPVWKYGEGADETRLGNTGLYFNLNPNSKKDIRADGTSATFHTGVAKLGSVDDFTIFKVPGLPEGDSPIVFDVFPGSPAIDDDGNIAFKGNYPQVLVGGEVLGQTGVYHRRVEDKEAGGDADIYVVANSETLIPGSPEGCQTDTFEGTTFGSTSPPSIAKNKMVFRGLDNEDDPSCGGIYEAGMDSGNFPSLTTLVDLETSVPGENPTAKFTRFGEALSYDGDAVAFWAGWGEDMETVSLCCPVHGNKDRKEFCLNNDTNTVCDDNAPEGCLSKCYQNKGVPVNQGIFVYNGGSITAVAKGSTTGGQDFISWNYSGKPPTAGSGSTTTGGGHHSYLRRRLSTDDDDDETDAAEEPRWRSSASLALSEPNNIVYKMISDDVAGIYHWNGGTVNSGKAIVETGYYCATLDDKIPTAPALVMAELAIERDSFRKSTDGSSILVLAASCGLAEGSGRLRLLEKDHDIEDIEDWGGIYLTKICDV